MMYAVTSQSHLRAMSLLTNDDSQTPKIAAAKQEFLGHLDVVEGLSPPDRREFFGNVRAANDRFARSSAEVLNLYEAGDVDQALKLHIDEEHPILPELEDAPRELVGAYTLGMAEAASAFASDTEFMTRMVLAFSVASLVFAVLLGWVLSAAFIRPVRRIEKAVAGVATGDFSQRVNVPNRDEFGALTDNVNRMTQRLDNLYHDMQDELNERRRAEENAQKRAVELVAVNSELESLNYSVTHDLRTPLRQVESLSQELLEEGRMPLPRRRNKVWKPSTPLVTASASSSRTW